MKTKLTKQSFFKSKSILKILNFYLANLSFYHSWMQQFWKMQSMFNILDVKMAKVNDESFQLVMKQDGSILTHFCDSIIMLCFGHQGMLYALH